MTVNVETKTCQNCRNQFVIELEDFDFYKKISVPPPTWCPECRLVRRLIWRNERTLYKRKCDAPGHSEDIISFIASEKPCPVYDQRYWWSDAWDATAYGTEYDFSKPFFVQLKEFFDRVPHPSLSTDYASLVNSDYSNWAGDLKNCYLVTDADYVEDSAYCSSIFKSKDCVDCNNISDSTLCYEGYNLRRCYRTVGSVNCHDCTDVFFSKGLVGCSYCFGCINLRKKSYYIFNEPYGKEEYRKRVAELFDGSRSGFEKAAREAATHWFRYPHKHLRGLHNVNSFGDYIYNCKNTKYGFFVSDVEDSKYVALFHSPGTKDCYDYTDWGDTATRVYDSIAIGYGAYDVKFSNLVIKETRDTTYSYFSINCSNIFGCASLRKKQYCILNKQYTQGEYEALLPKIIAHMNAMPYVDTQGRAYRYGEFFPPELSSFAYNESAAQEFFPLTESEANAKGFPWRKPEARQYVFTKKAAELPEFLRNVPDSITEEVIECAHRGACNQRCTTAFRIIPAELQFYRKMNIPLPRLCPNCRHYERLKQRNPLKLWHRRCTCAGVKSENGVYANTANHFHRTEHCSNEFETSYAPERPEIVYCEQCYQAEVA